MRLAEYFPSLWMAVRICGFGCLLVAGACTVAAMLTDDRRVES